MSVTKRKQILTLCFRKITGASWLPDFLHNFAKPCSIYLQLPQEVRKKSTTTKDPLSLAFSKILLNSSSQVNSLTHSTGQRSSSSSDNPSWYSSATLILLDQNVCLIFTRGSTFVWPRHSLLWLSLANKLKTTLEILHLTDFCISSLTLAKDLLICPEMKTCGIFRMQNLTMLVTKSLE